MLIGMVLALVGAGLVIVGMILGGNMRQALRRVGQYLGLIYQEDGTWRPGSIRRPQL